MRINFNAIGFAQILQNTGVPACPRHVGIVEQLSTAPRRFEWDE